jgi:hypothetical protein
MFFEHSPFPTVGSSAAYRESNFTSAERTKFPGRREKSREFLRFSRFCENLSRKHPRNQYLAIEFPAQTSRELFRARRELIRGFAPEQGIWRENRSLCSKLQRIKLRRQVAVLAERLHLISLRVDQAELTRSATVCTAASGRLPLSRGARAEWGGQGSQILVGRGGAERWRPRRSAE